MHATDKNSNPTKPHLKDAIPNLLMYWAQHTPDNAAICSPGEEGLTYKSLWETIRSVCGQLGENGSNRFP